MGDLPKMREFRSFLIEILPGGPSGGGGPDNLWQGVNDAFRQMRQVGPATQIPPTGLGGGLFRSLRFEEL